MFCWARATCLCTKQETTLFTGSLTTTNSFTSSFIRWMRSATLSKNMYRGLFSMVSCPGVDQGSLSRYQWNPDWKLSSMLKKSISVWAMATAGWIPRNWIKAKVPPLGAPISITSGRRFAFPTGSPIRNGAFPLNCLCHDWLLSSSNWLDFGMCVQEEMWFCESRPPS